MQLKFIANLCKLHFEGVNNYFVDMMSNITSRRMLRKCAIESRGMRKLIISPCSQLLLYYNRYVSS